MKEFVLNHKIRVLVIIAVVAAICFGAVRFMRPAGPGGETAYVEKVENLTGQNASLGLINRFAGIVEPQGTWSIARNTDVEIKEIFVEEGEEVEEGDPLFEYSILKYEEDLQQAEIDLEKVKIADEVTDEVCENCGRNMVIKYGPHGKFLACPGFPDCHNTKPYYEKIGVMCPKCGKDIVVKKTKKGRKYYGCMGNPECDFMSWQKPSDKKCPKCGGMMLEKGSRLVCENRDCGYMENRSDE